MRRLLTVVLGWWIASIMIIYEHMFYRNQIAAKRLKKIRTTVSEFTAAMQPAYGKTERAVYVRCTGAATVQQPIVTKS